MAGMPQQNDFLSSATICAQGNKISIVSRTVSKVQSDLLLVSLVCSLAVAAGCAGDTLDYTETKRIDEKVTETELQTFLRIIDSLPE